MHVDIRHDPSFAVARCHLDPRESLYVEPGAMAMQSIGMEIEAGLGSGGILRAVKRRMLSNESLFTSKISAPGDRAGWVDIAPSYPGDINVANITPAASLMVTKGAWLGASTSVDIDTKFGGSRMFMGGEGVFMMKCSGYGQVILAAYGGMDVHNLGQGDGITVDTGHVVAYQAGMNVNIRKAGKGVISSFTSKEGLVMDFYGPGMVITQSRNPAVFASFIQSLLPSSSAGGAD